MSRVAGAVGASDLSLFDVTPLILTLNEAPNIARCLDQLTWAARVVIVDSGSEDQTVAIAGQYPNVEVHTRTFDDHASQWNHGLSLIHTGWVLALDADYVVPAGFSAEASRVLSAGNVAAVFARFRYCVFGKPLRASLYPPRAVLFRPSDCRYEMDGHTQRLSVSGPTTTLETAFDHDDRKPSDRWFRAQRKYAALEAAKLRSSSALGLPDRARKLIVIAPPSVLFYTLFVKGTLLDGWPGWYYAYQRTAAEWLLSFELLRRRPGR